MKKRNVRILEKIADTLADQGVKFHFLDERWKKGGDVDISVAEKSLKGFDKVMKKNSFTFRGKWPPWYRFYRQFLNGEFILIHVHVGRYEGLPPGVLEPKKVKRPRGYLLPAEEQIFYFVYRMALGEPLQKYESYLRELVRRDIDKRKMNNLFASVFKNPSEISELIQKAEFSKLNPKFKSSHFFPRAKMYVLNKSARFARRIHKVFSPAPYISIVGPDGSGKTTALNSTGNMLHKHGISFARVTGGRFRFQVLPLNWMFEKAEERYFEGREDVSHHARRYPSSASRIVLPFVYFTEYLLRRSLIARPLRKKNQVVLSDRSFIDVVVSPNTNTTIAKALYGIFPKPDATIYLFNTADVLAKRRPDHPRHDLEMQLESYNSLASYFTHKIKTTKKKETTKEIFSIILQQV
jgi:thymidylate kinase